jgi:hypothetical protein
MKRSEALTFIEGLFKVGIDFDDKTKADNLLCHLEQAGVIWENEWEQEELECPKCGCPTNPCINCAFKEKV